MHHHLASCPTTLAYLLRRMARPQHRPRVTTWHPTRTPKKKTERTKPKPNKHPNPPTNSYPAATIPRGRTQQPDTRDEDMESWSDRAPTPTAAPRRSARSSNMTREDLVDLPSEVKHLSSSYKFLKSAGFMTEDDPDTSLPQLALILLQITVPFCMDATGFWSVTGTPDSSISNRTPVIRDGC